MRKKYPFFLSIHFPEYPFSSFFFFFDVCYKKIGVSGELELYKEVL